MGSVVALAGQVGGAKLADGLYRLRKDALTVVVNTGDDYEHLGLAFSPDLDTMLYVLAGIASPAASWEPENETHSMHAMLRLLGGPDRPVLGDRSLAAPLLRAQGLAAERRLTEITQDFCRNLGIGARVLPMSDDRVRTHVLTDDAAVTFPDSFAPDLEAVIICPANPYHVIRPILEVAGMKELLRKRGAPIIAVTPIVGGRALAGSAAKMMRELGREPTPRAVATEYLRLIDGFVLDSEDAGLLESVGSLGMQVVALPTIMRSLDDRVALAHEVLDFAAAIRSRKQAEVE